MKLSEDTRMFLAIISLGLGVVGFFFFGLWVGPPAIICGVLALYTPSGAKAIPTAYRICAIFGLLLGIFEVILGIMFALEFYGLAEFGLID